MARIRTFIALDLGKPLRDRLVGLQETLARTGAEVKWVEPENLHVTLLFLGEVDEREVPQVCKAVQTVAAEHETFSAAIAKTGCFPNLRRPRTIWVGVDQGLQEVVALHDGLEKPLLELGCYRREERAYTPHITLGRVKSDRPMTELATALTRHQDYKAGETIIKELHVMSSHLTSKGPQYTVLARCKLS